MKKKCKASIISFSILSVLSLALIAGNVVCFKVLGVDFINAALSGTGASKGDEESAAISSELVKKISEEGTVLLKNEHNCLPLDLESNNKVNVFGYTATDNAWVFTGVGSGSCKPDPKKRIGFLKGLENAGFEYNKEIIEAYQKEIPTSDPWMSMNQYSKIIQPDVSFYTESMINSAKAFSDTAIVVLSRISGENVGEVPTVQTDYVTGAVDESRSYLEIAKKEEDMLNLVKANFNKVIVVLNTTNNMQCGFLNDDKISAALYCGPTGLNGTESIANLLAGRKKVIAEDGSESYQKVSPSGKLADTFAYDYTIEPSYPNHVVSNKKNTGGNIVYQEGLYYGYRWYETSYQEGYLPNYYDYVQYPFGYGLSYTSFSWTVTSLSLPSGSTFSKDSKIEVKVSVKNEGQYPGKDVVELYYSTPYIKGGIEKSAITLADFAKTATLNPGESQEVTLALSVYDMASYDCYDKNNNGHTGYELDQGDYKLSLRSDVHTLKEVNGGNEFTYTLTSSIDYDRDPSTNYYVINRFTGDDAYAGISIDGSNVGLNAKYLSRNDFYSTMVDKQAPLPSDTNKVNKGRLYQSSARDQETMPTFGVDKGLYLAMKSDGTKATAKELDERKDLVYNYDLIDQLMESYDNPLWDDLVNEVNLDSAVSLVEKSGFGSAAIEEIGKIKTLDFDGPSGFNENTQKIAEDKSAWTSYPSECVIGCTWNEELAHEIGRSMALEAHASGINGWYAPGVNLHRSNYNGRNYEYYSEDPILSGKLAAGTIMGAKSGGLYCYLKHFAVSEEGDNPKGVDTWLTEQVFREIYLKPFEIAVKAGANAIMTAFNRIASIWVGACYDLLTEVLRNEWGFKGSVVTDWSSGDEIMNPTRGVIAGNDLWLNPMGQNYAPLDKKDPTVMYCAKEAVKNNLFTFVSTLHYAKHYDSSNDPYQVEVSIKQSASGSNWWIPTIVSIDVVVFLSFIAVGIFTFVPFKREETHS